MGFETTKITRATQLRDENSLNAQDEMFNILDIDIGSVFYPKKRRVTGPQNHLLQASSLSSSSNVSSFPSTVPSVMQSSPSDDDVGIATPLQIPLYDFQSRLSQWFGIDDIICGNEERVFSRVDGQLQEHSASQHTSGTGRNGKTQKRAVNILASPEKVQRLLPEESSSVMSGSNADSGSVRFNTPSTVTSTSIHPLSSICLYPGSQRREQGGEPARKKQRVDRDDMRKKSSGSGLGLESILKEFISWEEVFRHILHHDHSASYNGGQERLGEILDMLMKIFSEGGDNSLKMILVLTEKTNLKVLLEEFIDVQLNLSQGVTMSTSDLSADGGDVTFASEKYVDVAVGVLEMWNSRMEFDELEDSGEERS